MSSLSPPWRALLVPAPDQGLLPMAGVVLNPQIYCLPQQDIYAQGWNQIFQAQSL